MWIINTLLDGGSIEEAVVKAMVMNAKRPSYFPPQGLVLTLLERLSQTTPVIQEAIEVRALD